MVAITDEKMYKAAQLVFLPIILIISFALFQYLSFMYYNRRKEPRGMLLLGSAFLGFAVLVPLAHPSEELVHHLNDISEACSTLTFLIQITIIGRESSRKVKIKALFYLTVAAEVLIAAEIAVIFLDMIEVFDPSIGRSISKEFNQIVEDVTLACITVFRFYYLSQIHGFRAILRTKKLELFVYMLFLTHEYPFLVLEETTHVTWEYVQGVYHRLLIVWCIGLTIKEKLKKGVRLSLTSRNTSAVPGSKKSNGGTSESRHGTDAGAGASSTKGPPVLSLASVVPQAVAKKKRDK